MPPAPPCEDWGRRTARYFQQKASEVKEMLLAMARTTECVGERDQRCAHQIDEVTAQLRRIARSTTSPRSAFP